MLHPVSPTSRALPGLLAGILVVAACAGEAPDVAEGGILGYCSQAGVESLNPFVSADQGSIDLADLVFTPLVRYDEDGGFEPYLARGWEWSEDGRTLALRIRDDLSWHDGRPLTTEDVAWTIRAAADPAYAYWSGGDFEGVEEASATEAGTVVVRYRDPPAAGLEPFVALPVLPRHLLSDIPPAELPTADFNRAPVGSGPYRVAERLPDGSIVFERSGSFPADLGAPSIGRIVFRTVPEATSLVAELATGGADVCLATSLAAERLEAAEEISVMPLRPPGVQAIILDTRSRPLGDVRVRRALSAALDRDRIAAAVSPVAERALGLLPPDSPWHDSALAQPDATPALADSLFDAAGWRRGRPGGVRTGPGGEEFVLEVLAPPQFESALTVVQAQLAEAGVRVELRFMEFASLIPTIVNPETRPAAMAIGFGAERVRHPGFYDLLHSAGQQNLASWSDAAADSALTALRAAREPDELRALYGRLQSRVAEEVPILYTLYVPRLLAVGPRVEGVAPDLDGPLANVHEWKLRGR